MIYRLYRGVTTLLSPIGAIFLLGAQLFSTKEKRNIWRQRRGVYTEIEVLKKPRVWLHAASVGEMCVAEALIPHVQKMCPGIEIFVSVMTRTGYAYAQKNMPQVPIFMVPVDFPCMVKRALRKIQPTVLAILETELWPNLITDAYSQKVPVCLINGRISRRTGRNCLSRQFYSSVLSLVSKFSMTNDRNKDRIIDLGADLRRVVVYPNAKFDALPGRKRHIEETAFLDPLAPYVADKKVFVAGSIRYREFSEIIQALRQIAKDVPETIFVLVPRHLNRVDLLLEELYNAGFQPKRYSEIAQKKEDSTVWVVDTMGDLFSIYRHATVAFCGSSLVDLGGQNILEPAAWKKPVASGPFLDDFEMARERLLKYGAIQLVETADALANVVIDLLKNPEKQRQVGENAYKAFETMLGGSEQHAKEIAKLL